MRREGTLLAFEYAAYCLRVCFVDWSYQVMRDFGRPVYGVAAVVLGALTLHYHPYREWIVYAVAAAALAGGIAIQWRRTAQFGAVVLGALYLAFAMFCLPGIFHAPLIYNNWGNFFEQFSMFSGALIAYAALASGRSPSVPRATGIGRIIFGVCVVSFALEQAFYLHATANFAPKWLPPGQMFWAITTTVFLALAALGILSGLQSLLASRLLTAMLLLFGLLVWLPALFADPRSQVNWSESAETVAIAGVAWMLADYLGKLSGSSR